jgi:hypothetical protein
MGGLEREAERRRGVLQMLNNHFGQIYRVPLYAA